MRSWSFAATTTTTTTAATTHGSGSTEKAGSRSGRRLFVRVERSKYIRFTPALEHRGRTEPCLFSRFRNRKIDFLRIDGRHCPWVTVCDGLHETVLVD
uniref:Putative secreted peptide n=1 Tax=Anopheles braziliensis TaxID=58242 RepID=A0A2M3ZT55_9DIPT